MELKTTPLWREQAPLAALLGRDEVPTRADVAIVGGGYTGLGAARVLARAGARVVVLEAGEIGGGASARNGGQALVGLKLDASTVAKRLGVGVARELWEASRAGIRGIGRVCREEHIECNFKTCGSLYLAAKPAHYTGMRRESDWLARHFGYQRSDLPRAALAEEIGSTAFHGGSLDPESAALHPGKWVRGLAHAAQRAGARLCAGARVHSIETGPGRHTLRLDHATLGAKEVLVATNGYLDDAVLNLAGRILAIESSVIATEPLAESLRMELIPKGRLYYDSRRLLAYFRLSPDGRMVFGGRAIGSSQRNRAATWLRRELVALFPALRETRVTHCWSGRLALSPDGLPHIGRARGVHYALGFGGHGVALSHLLGTESAEIIAGKRESSVFLEIPHPSSLLYRGGPWLRSMRVAQLRFLDWIT